MSLLRIAYITNNFSPYRGGVVSSIRAYTHELRKRGHHVVIISLDFLGDAQFDEPYVQRLYCPLKFSLHDRPLAVPWRTHAQLKRMISDFKPDIIHVHHPFLLGFSAGQLGKEMGIPVVFTYHTLYEHYLHYVPLIPRFVTQPIMQQRVKKFVCTVDQVIAPSSYVKKLLSGKDSTVPVEVLPSPLRDIFFVHNEHKHGIGHVANNKFKLVTVSRFEKEKNIEYLLSMFALLDQQLFTFHLVGYGSHFESLKQYAYRELGLSEKTVRFVVQPPQDELLRSYGESDLFLFASLSETQGLVLAESMACGTPVLALDGPGQRDIVVNGENGYLVNSSHEMVQRIVELQADPTHLASLACGALRTAQIYHPQSLSKRLVHLYESLLDR